MKIKRQLAATDPHQERGSVVVIALVLLVLLTIIGISASRTTEIELMIAGNERVAKQNFYVAEGATMQAAQILELTDLEYSPPGWLMDEYNKNSSGVELPAASYSKISEHIHEGDNWTNDFSQQLTTSALPGEARVLALSKGIVPTSSWKMTSPKVYEYEVYGRSRLHRGEGLVSVGYRKAY